MQQETAEERTFEMVPVQVAANTTKNPVPGPKRAAAVVLVDANQEEDGGAEVEEADAPSQPDPAEGARVKAEDERKRVAALQAYEKRKAEAEAKRQRKAADKKADKKAAEAAKAKAEREKAANEQVLKERSEAEDAREERLALEKEKLALERADRERRAEQALQENRKAEPERKDGQRAEAERQAALKAQQEKLAQERTLAAARKRELARVAEAEWQAAQRAQAEQLAHDRLAAEKAEQARRAAVAAVERANAEQRALTTAAKDAQLAKAGSSVSQAPPPVKPVEPAKKETVGPRPSEKAPEEKGIVIPSVHGDLKLIVAGAGDVKLSVTFTEYPKSKRGRALSRSETRREQKITPVVVKTAERTQEATVEKTGEGIYTFIAEPEGKDPAKLSLKLKVFELSKAGKTKQLGTKTLAGKGVVAKVLMPEGILWEEESAFTGSMQDSDGITKFNAETGLIWKEYTQ